MADLTGQQLKNSYQNLVTIDATIESNPTSGQLENGLGNPITALGIGTDSPASPLTISRTNQLGSNEYIRLVGSSGSLTFGVYPSSGNSFSFIGSNTNYTSGGISRIDASFGGSLLSLNKDSIIAYVSSGVADPTEAMRIASSGAVGIGTETGTLFTKMSIANSLSNTSIGTNYNPGILNIQNKNTTNGNLSLIGFQDASASINLAAVGAINTVHSASPNSVVGELGFYTKASGGGYVAERMRIDSSGNVGIGVTPSGAKFHTVSTNSTAKFESSTTGLFNTYKNSNGEFAYVGTGSQTVSGGSADDLGIQAVNNFVIGTGGNTERMRIDSSGNVGIGTDSPTVPSSNATTLHIKGAVATKGGAVRLSSSDDSVDAYLYPSSSSFNIGSITSHDVNIVANNSPRMTIDTSGNVLIGTTATPTSSAGNIVLKNGTAPTGNATDGVILYAEDVSTSSELKVRDEAGNVTTLSPHNFSLIPDGASEPMAWAYYSERDGKKINVDMLKLARMVESLTGEKLVYEQ